MANLNSDQLVVWRNELDTDPLARGYAGMTDQQATESGNTADRPATQAIPVSEWESAIRHAGKWTQFKERSDLQTTPGIYDNPEMFEIMSTFNARTDAVDLRGDSYWSDLLDAAVAAGDLGAGAAEQMKALCDTMISRATELGLPVITTQDTIDARAL
jgi:hypothetical protein